MQYEVTQTAEFANWLADMNDRIARRAITARVVRVQSGLLGDVRAVGNGVSELRFDVGPGYRAYFCRTGSTVVLLLCGGDKSTQARDIARAKKMASSL